MNKLLLIQSELKAPKGQFNSFGKYKYRSCEDILEALKPLLKKHECTLIISDEIKQVGETIYVEATCHFSDGEIPVEVKAQAGIDVNRKGMDVAQCFGASSSYARKYCLSGLFLLDDNKDPDSTNDHSDKPKITKNPAPTPEQFDALVQFLQGTDKQKTAAKEALKKYTLTDKQQEVINGLK